MQRRSHVRELWYKCTGMKHSPKAQQCVRLFRLDLESGLETFLRYASRKGCRCSVTLPLSRRFLLRR